MFFYFGGGGGVGGLCSPGTQFVLVTPHMVWVRLIIPTWRPTVVDLDAAYVVVILEGK